MIIARLCCLALAAGVRGKEFKEINIAPTKPRSRFVNVRRPGGLAKNQAVHLNNAVNWERKDSLASATTTAVADEFEDDWESSTTRSTPLVGMVENGEPPPFTGRNEYTGTPGNYPPYDFWLPYYPAGWALSLRPPHCRDLIDVIGYEDSTPLTPAFWQSNPTSPRSPAFYEMRHPNNCTFPLQLAFAFEMSDAMWNFTQLVKIEDWRREQLTDIITSRFNKVEAIFTDYQDMDKHGRGSNGSYCLKPQIETTNNVTHLWDAFQTYFYDDVYFPHPGGPKTLDMGTFRNAQFMSLTAIAVGSKLYWKPTLTEWGRAVVLVSASGLHHAADGCMAAQEHPVSVPITQEANDLWTNCTNSQITVEKELYYPTYYTALAGFDSREIRLITMQLNFTYIESAIMDHLFLHRLLGQEDDFLKVFQLDGLDFGQGLADALDLFKKRECVVTDQMLEEVRRGEGMWRSGITVDPHAPLSYHYGKPSSMYYTRSWASRMPSRDMSRDYRELRRQKMCFPPLDILFVQEASTAQSGVIRMLSNTTMVARLRNILSPPARRYVRLGVASFQDMPATNEEDAYCYEVHQPLTDSADLFTKAYGSITPHPNLSNKRNSQFIALYEALAPQSEVGWMPLKKSSASKLVILLTSTKAHHARDGLNVAKLKSFEGDKCGESYYPHPHQLAAQQNEGRTYVGVLVENNTADVIEDYEWLVNLLGESRHFVQPIRSDGSDVVNKIVDLVQMIQYIECGDLLGDLVYEA